MRESETSMTEYGTNKGFSKHALQFIPGHAMLYGSALMAAYLEFFSPIGYQMAGLDSHDSPDILKPDMSAPFYSLFVTSIVGGVFAAYDEYLVTAVNVIPKAVERHEQSQLIAAFTYASNWYGLHTYYENSDERTLPNRSATNVQSILTHFIC